MKLWNKKPATTPAPPFARYTVGDLVWYMGGLTSAALASIVDVSGHWAMVKVGDAFIRVTWPNQIAPRTFVVDEASASGESE